MKQARHNSGDPRFTILMRPVQQNNPVIQEIRHVRCQVVLQTEIFLLLPCFNLVGTFLRVLRYFVSLSLITPQVSNTLVPDFDVGSKACVLFLSVGRILPFLAEYVFSNSCLHYPVLVLLCLIQDL